jgi:centrosomal protein CEP290
LTEQTDNSKIKKAFAITQHVLKKVNEQSSIVLQTLEEEVEKAAIQENELERVREKLQLLQQDSRNYSNTESRELQDELIRLEGRLQESETRFFQEKTDNEKCRTVIQGLEKTISDLNRENQRYLDEIKENAMQIQHYRDEKFSRTGEEVAMHRERMNEKNKIINELEDENLVLADENLKLNKFLEQTRADFEESTHQMNKTKDEIYKFRLSQRNYDSQLEELKKENEMLKSQIEVLNVQLTSHNDQDAAIMNTVEARVREFKTIIDDKEEEIKQLRELVIQMNDGLNRAQVDSDKASVDKLTVALADRNKEIEVLKQKIQEYTQLMSIHEATMSNLNKTFVENSKMYSQSESYNMNKQAEQKLLFLEKMLRENESRLKDSEQHASEKDKELAIALNRLREYESGDYQLQQAVNEIKELKGQINLLDRDVEKLTKHINKLDYTLNDILEENDSLRAKLGMEPRERLNLDELNNLKAVRAQESRAVVHVLQREIESLEEQRIQLKQTIRKLARQCGPNVNVASILDDDLADYDYLIASKSQRQDKNKPPLDKKNTTDPTIDKNTLKNMESLKVRYDQLLQRNQETENENNLLARGLTELNQQISNINNSNTQNKNVKKVNSKTTTINKSTINSSNTTETILKCPSLEKLLATMDANKASRNNMKNYSFLNQFLSNGNLDDITMALKSEVDFLQGRNEELRTLMTQTQNDFNRNQSLLQKAEDEVN